MKLIYCLLCGDLVKLRTDTKRTCFCGKSSGMYTSNIHAVISGPCLPVGISNYSMDMAFWYQDIFSGWFYGHLIPHHDDIEYEGEAPVTEVINGHFAVKHSMLPKGIGYPDEQDNKRDTDSDTEQRGSVGSKDPQAPAEPHQ